MGADAKAGTCLMALVEMALPLLREAERQCPRTGPGAKPVIPDVMIGLLIMVAVLKGKKSKSSQYRFLSEKSNRKQIGAATGNEQFPARSTFFRRYRRASGLFRTAIRLQGEQAIAEGVTAPRDVAVDKSLVAAHGPAWHKRERERGKVPAGVDRDSTWGDSEHDGWVQGYSYEVVVSATPGTIVFPLQAAVDTASTSETRTFAEKIEQLPHSTKTVSADSAYDTHALGEGVEFNDRRQRTGRRFLCPENPRHGGRPQTKPSHASTSLVRSRALRHDRKRFFSSRRGRRIYARRKKTVEPFNQWFKSLFELEGRVWHRGLENNRTQILAAIFGYQLLVRYNFRRGNKNGRVRWILDTL